MVESSLVEVLDDLPKVRNILLSCRTRDEVVKTALSIVSKKLHSQTASIFLFSKDGRLERVGIQGIDVNGNLIDDNWFPEESYEVGESFTGKVVLHKEDSKYGERQWSDNLNEEQLSTKSRIEYVEKLGKIECAMGVPLNGQHRTYGMLEIINKLDQNKRIISYSNFSREEIYWLDSIGANVATCLSNLRRNNQIKMLTELGSLLVESSANSDWALQSTGSHIVKKLLNPDTSFKVCILRIGIKPEPLKVIAKGKVEGVNWEGRKRDEEREYGEGLVGEAVENGEPVIVEGISGNLNKFYNQEWIKNNKLESFACFPLVTKEGVVGAISLFSGYNYNFHDNIIALLKSVTSLVASFVQRVIASGELQRLEKQLNDERNARFISGYSLSREELLHEYKNELLSLQHVFKELKETTSKRESEKIIGNQIEWIKDRVKQIQGQFEEYVPVPVDINQIIQEVVKHLSHEIRSGNKNIHFIQNYNNQIPRIMANPIEIKEVIRNLISNAIKAVQRIGKAGEIRLSTAITESKSVDYIEVSVNDNGIGIRKEYREKVFDKGFTTFEKEGGTGIGLFVTQKIINKYGGQIYYESVVGKGTQFFVRLPLRLQE